MEFGYFGDPFFGYPIQSSQGLFSRQQPDRLFSGLMQKAFASLLEVFTLFCINLQESSCFTIPTIMVELNRKSKSVKGKEADMSTDACQNVESAEENEVLRAWKLHMEQVKNSNRKPECRIVVAGVMRTSEDSFLHGKRASKFT